MFEALTKGNNFIFSSRLHMLNVCVKHPVCQRFYKFQSNIVPILMLYVTATRLLILNRIFPLHKC